MLETYFIVLGKGGLNSTPWNESTKIDEKLKFVSRFLDGEKIAPLCA
jgi:hypothetical protein